MGGRIVTAQRGRHNSIFSFLRRALCLILALSFCFALCGCDLFAGDEELITPPRPQGELYEIKQSLEQAEGGKLALKYPTKGEHRSAIISVDVTGNGENDAVAFYATESENITYMHIAVVSRRGEEWVTSNDVPVMASGIEQVKFVDLDGNGVSEILVGWSVYGNVDKEIAVYSFDGEELSSLLKEKYTEFLCCDFDTDQKQELFVLHLNQTNKTAVARCFGMTEGEIGEISKTVADGNVSSYAAVCEGKLLNGKPAIYADAQKGGTMITEVFYLDGARLVNPLCDADSRVTIMTERPTSFTSRDITGDGIIDIPMAETLPGYGEAQPADKIYMTHWCSFDGQKLVVTLNALMNYPDGYYFTVPKTHEHNITLERNIESRMRIVYLCDPETGARIADLFRIKAVNSTSYDPALPEYGGWEKIAETESLTYLVKHSGYNGEGALSLAQIKESFKLIATK